MGKIVKLRKSGDSLILTMPKQIAEMYSLAEKSEMEIVPFTSDSFQVKVKYNGRRK